jgi:S1-C subfamily serine protease
MSTSSSNSNVPFVAGVSQLDVTMTEHRPNMGCTVEESLAEPGTVFVSSIKVGGPASAAGILQGDVVIGITGLFGTLEDVSGLGIDKV